MAKEKAEILHRRKPDTTRPNPEPGEIEAAYEEVRTLVPLHEDPKTKAGLEAHPVLPGVTQTTGHRIQTIVSLRVDGFRDKDISEQLGISQPLPYQLERDYPQAFAAAEAHHLQAADRKQQINNARSRASLSKYVPRMIEVLANLAENPKIKENVRRSAATDIINLAGVGYARQTHGGKDNNTSAGAKNFVQTIINQPADSSTTTVVEAEDAEFVEG